MTIDDPDTYEPTRDELLMLNAALRLRLDLTVSALRGTLYALRDVSYDLPKDADPEITEYLRGAYEIGDGALDVATGQSSDIPHKLALLMSTEQRNWAKRLLEAARP